MKVLFVCSGNSKKFDVVPFIKAQGKSLRSLGIDLDYFPIQGHGFKGYIRNIIPLREKVQNNQYDLIHAHYSLSSFIATLSTIGLNIPQVTSLMGSDANSNTLEKFIINIFESCFWNSTIVKSKDMANQINLNKVNVIPNGVDLDIFHPMDKYFCKQKVGFSKSIKQIIWVSDPSRESKNYSLASRAYKAIDDQNCKLKIINNVHHNMIPFYLNSADVLLLSSQWEGSPNIIKEAMACNTPIVSTNVGDVEWLIDGVDGCYLTDFHPEDVADKLKKALEFSQNIGKTKARERLITLGLDAKSIAKKIIKIYKDTLHAE